MTNYIKNLVTALTVVLVCYTADAQKLAALQVDLTNETAGIDVPVSVDLDAITFLPDSVLTLNEVADGKHIPVSYQIDNSGKRMLYWLIKTKENQDKKRVFELSKGIATASAGHIKAGAADGFLDIVANGHALLRYNYKVIYPTKGTDTVFKRSGFIHPLYSPHGQELTRINAWDHPHHFGLWNPWTHVLFERDTIDFWNLIKKQGTVRFANFTSVNDGAVYADYKTLQQHVVFKKDGSEKVAINEVQSVRIYQPEKEQAYYLMDITIHLNAASDSPVTLLKYSYSGLGWRATEKWNRDNSEVLTSEGKARKDADGTRARWCLVQGKIDDDYAGAVMMSYPANYNYPEPLRVWPENIFNRGDMYANFVPVKDRDWLIAPGKDYVLKYRFVVFNGHFDKAKSEAAWQNYAHPPVVKIKLSKDN
jgi:hypothetical protein